jgi:hypothetical protein
MTVRQSFYAAFLAVFAVAGHAQVADSSTAAQATAENNPMCTAVSPFYVSIVDYVSGTSWSQAINTTQPTWVATTHYPTGARVMYDGAAYPYLSLTGIGNTDQAPNTPDSTYWTALSAVTATTPMSIASASKWEFASFMAMKESGIQSFSRADLAAMNFTDGYANMGSETQGQTCPPVATAIADGNYSDGGVPMGTTQDIYNCLQQNGLTSGYTSKLMTYQIPDFVGTFNYDSGHEENIALTDQSVLGIAYLNDTQLMSAYVTAGIFAGTPAGTNIFTQPLLAGGIYQRPDAYMDFLATMISNNLMRSILPDTRNAYNNAVIAYCGTSQPNIGPGYCGSGPPYTNNVSYSPITSMWDYVVGYWWEIDFSSYALNDASVSSPGAFGMYGFITPSCPDAGHPGYLCQSITEFKLAGYNPWRFYGVVAQQVPEGSGGPTGNGQASAACGALIRYSYATGTELLTQSIPPN